MFEDDISKAQIAMKITDPIILEEIITNINTIEIKQELTKKLIELQSELEQQQ